MPEDKNLLVHDEPGEEIADKENAEGSEFAASEEKRLEKDYKENITNG